MKKMRFEAAVTRGYPLALVLSGLTLMQAGRLFPKIQRWQKYLLAGTVGKFFNRLCENVYMH